MRHALENSPPMYLPTLEQFRASRRISNLVAFFHYEVGFACLNNLNLGAYVQPKRAA